MPGRLFCFCLIAAGYSWGLYFTVKSFGVDLTGLTGGAVLFTYMFGPAIGGLITALLFDRGRLVEMFALRIMPNWWWLAALIVPAIALGVSTFVSQYFPGVELVDYREGMKPMIEQYAGGEDVSDALDALPPLWLLFILSLFSGAAINGVLTLSEELGWRGYLWTVLRRGGFWMASLATGLLWGLWHLPIIIDGYNYPGEPIWGPVMMIAFTLALSPWMGYLRDKSGSVFTGSIFHGVINGLAGLMVVSIATENVFYRGIIGLPGVAVLCVMTLPLLFMRHDRVPGEDADAD